MFCKNCGNKLNDNVAFCPKCGAKVMVQRIERPTVQMQKPKKRLGFIFLVGMLMVIAGIGIGAVILTFKEKDGEEKTLAEDSDKQETGTEGMPEEGSVWDLEIETVKEDEQEEAVGQTTDNQIEQGTVDAEDPYALFGITKGTIESYASALNTNNYQYYNSGIANFRFFYPAELYSDVIYNEQETETLYGTNVKTIDFAGSAGSELVFSLSRYEEGTSIEQISENIYNTEKAGLLDASDVVYGTYEDHGRIIVTGYTGEDLKLVYDLFHVDSEYVMQMKIVFPAYQGMEDKFQKDYVTECLYRLCGFSGSTANCRSYETYKAESLDLEAEIAKIKEQYYSVQDRLNDMEITGTDDVTLYMEEKNVYKIVVAKGTQGIEYSREYSFIDGRLYFTFVYDGESEQRFYFVDDMLIRYIDENSDIYDLEDADYYMQIASEYQDEAYQLLGEMWW